MREFIDLNFEERDEDGLPYAGTPFLVPKEAILSVSETETSQYCDTKSCYVCLEENIAVSIGNLPYGEVLREWDVPSQTKQYYVVVANSYGEIKEKLGVKQ